MSNSTPEVAKYIAEVNAYVRMAGKLKIKAFFIENTLLVGPPGTGKTFFASKLFRSMSLPFYKLSLSEAQDGFFLTGSQKGFSNSTPGRIADRLSHSEAAKPGFIIDELDKVSWEDGFTGRKGYMPAILQLLERDSAAEFRDLSLDLAIDVSHASWIATANSLSGIPDSVLSRFKVVELLAPSGEAMCTIAESIFSDCLTELLGETHELEFCVEEEAAEVLNGVTPRMLKSCARKIIVGKMIEGAFEDYIYISAADLWEATGKEKALLSEKGIKQENILH